VRYIGNKTRLLSFIGDCLDELKLTDGRALDAFAGTVSVGAYLRKRGFHVAACDIMSYSYVFQRARLTVDKAPAFAGLQHFAPLQRARRKAPFAAAVDGRLADFSDRIVSTATQRAIAEVVVFLDSFLEPQEGFFSRSFAADVTPLKSQRMYFTKQNATRIDAARTQMHLWRQCGAITEPEYYLLLASLIDAADAVANTTGVYAAYVKSWQSNATRDLKLAIPDGADGAGNRGQAHQGDINQLIAGIGPVKLLYIDPPYNSRQYSGYYHIPELLARGWFGGEPALRGKTGLLEDAHLKSDWCSRARCVHALEQLLANASADHILMSYNNEGIIPEADIKRLFTAAGRRGSYRRFERPYARYRADSDSKVRRYKSDEVSEYLYYVRTNRRNGG
jgi:adenine-specific DNA-methyltransferase